eukprot:365491-Chlamydomonas_euryale.AAC.4
MSTCTAPWCTDRLSDVRAVPCNVHRTMAYWSRWQRAACLATCIVPWCAGHVWSRRGCGV